MRGDDLIALIVVFVPLSLVSVGGGSSIIAAIQHEAVTVRGWLDEREFLNLFAIARATPGPGTMLGTIIGWKVAGWGGALVATLAFYVPSALLCYGVLRATNAHRDKKWHRAAREGLAPVGTGLVIAGVIAIFRMSEGGWLGAGIAVAAASILLVAPRFPTLGVLALGAVAPLAVHALLS